MDSYYPYTMNYATQNNIYTIYNIQYTIYKIKYTIYNSNTQNNIQYTIPYIISIYNIISCARVRNIISCAYNIACP